MYKYPFHLVPEVGGIGYEKTTAIKTCGMAKFDGLCVVPMI